MGLSYLYTTIVFFFSENNGNCLTSVRNVTVKRGSVLPHMFDLYADEDIYSSTLIVSFQDESAASKVISSRASGKKPTTFTSMET